MHPFNVLPSPPTYRSIRLFHWSKQCWKYSFVRAFRSSAEFRFTSSIDSNRVLFKADLIFGTEKSHRVLSQASTARIRVMQCIQRLNNASQPAQNFHLKSVRSIKNTLKVNFSFLLEDCIFYLFFFIISNLGKEISW